MARGWWRGHRWDRAPAQGRWQIQGSKAGLCGEPLPPRPAPREAHPVVLSGSAVPTWFYFAFLLCRMGLSILCIFKGFESFF